MTNSIFQNNFAHVLSELPMKLCVQRYTVFVFFQLGSRIFNLTISSILPDFLKIKQKKTRNFGKNVKPTESRKIQKQVEISHLVTHMGGEEERCVT